MRGPLNIVRLVRMGATFERTGAMGILLESFNAPPLLRAAARTLAWPFRWMGRPGDPGLPPVPRALVAMGPAYVKFGQILSTRPDVVGAPVAEQLRFLQDRLPPFPTEQARVEIARELGQTAESLFSEFSGPVAAASLAQVHRARLRATGEAVAVKVLRPGIERAFRRDIDALRFTAQVIHALVPSARRLRPLDVIAHFEGVVRGELDLRLEAAASSEFAANTARDAGFRVPAVRWSLTARRVLTMDWVEGIGAADTTAIRAAGHDTAELAQRVLRLFLSHALRDGYFHGDMHQGNLKVAPDGDLVAFDFGIMGRIDDYTRRVYAEILWGFIRRDYRRVAEVHFEAGYVPPDRSVDAFAQALRAVGEPIFGMDASHISMSRLLAYLFEVTERFGMRTRTELILLQRTMVVVEGVARSLDPRMNIWEAARPVVEAYIRDSLGPRALARDMARTARVLAAFSPRLPDLVREGLTRADEALPPPPRAAARAAMAAWAAAGLAVGILGTLVLTGP
ncbi:2-polyprenylphenol 6-hydroxylase [Rubellimicrobium sp. CFH 75288]|uniref:2-polyprenylphenol 6-hydroxylase n=1 Tax=Rubellimicrobium sp. CFH 75288 TaxID=2697034 RepID=UPI0014124F15|nr:2-polyprenylphenol 6-hydroxylase [Rubellimicrobium sp. CFH 75288]NAZ37306.1 2-polyprenylphenol 6-hydroxylase [Rubellimicrobium sp. CFH 75288]